MAKALSGMETFNDSPAPTRSLRAVWNLRLALGSLVLFGTILFFLGTSWDIQWHILIGRDRTLIPPHEVMLTGVGLSGIAALAAILIETLWARRSPIVAQSGTSFADAFHGPLGAYLAGFAALDAAIAFPLDAYWHSLYGIDVSGWAPFHIMFAAGMAIVALGAAYMLTSAAHLAASAGAVKTERLGYAAALVAFASMMSIFTYLLFNALDRVGYIDLGVVTINAFPVLAALLGTWSFVSVVHAVPGRWGATRIAVVSLILVGIVAIAVPPATDLLMRLEHLNYRGAHPGIALVAAQWPLASFIAAIVIDSVARRAQRKGWSRTRLTVSMTLLSLVLCVPVLPVSPLQSLNLVQHTGTIGFVISLLFGWLGAGVGTWFGARMGTSLQELERGA